jgi:G3E family GTPase
MNPLPLTVISGYLGAGKTTLINRLLAGSHRLKLMVMVNDFGAINIDQALIAAQGKDVIALTNGCVCCTMGADLFMALGDALDRRPRPDHLIIEASGIADPKAIANTAIAEPDMRYAGIVTLVDALNIQTLLNDPLVAPQVQQQIAAADLVVQTKAEMRVPAVDAVFAENGLQPPEIIDATVISILTLDAHPNDIQSPSAPHPAYVSWHHQSDHLLDHDALVTALKERPPSLYRLKGLVPTQNGTFEIHIVGNQFDIKQVDGSFENAMVGLGLRERITASQIADWWQAIAPAQSAVTPSI